MKISARTAGNQDTLEAAYGNGRYLAVGKNGVVVQSLNGTQWSVQPSFTSVSLRGVAFGNRGDGKAVSFRSTDGGQTWTTQVLELEVTRQRGVRGRGREQGRARGDPGIGRRRQLEPGERRVRVYPQRGDLRVRPVFQGPAMNITGPVTALEGIVLGSGVYRFYFMVDQRDGIINYPYALVGTVTVTAP